MEVINKLKKNVSDALTTFLSNHTNIEVSIFLEHELRPIITKYTNTQETNAENIQNVQQLWNIYCVISNNINTVNDLNLLQKISDYVYSCNNECILKDLLTSFA